MAEKLKNETVYFNLEMYYYCPECEDQIDLEDENSEKWLPIFKDWINNKRNSINEQIECPYCNHVFTVTEIER